MTLETDIRFASADDRAAFAKELSTAVARLAAKYRDADTPGGRTFRLIVGAYPAPAHTKSPSEKGSPS